MHFYDSATAECFRKLEEYAKKDIILRRLSLTELALIYPRDENRLQYCTEFDSADKARRGFHNINKRLREFSNMYPMPDGELNGQTKQDLELICSTIDNILRPFIEKGRGAITASMGPFERGMLPLLMEELASEYILPRQFYSQAADNIKARIEAESNWLNREEIIRFGAEMAQEVRNTVSGSFFGRSADLKRRSLGIPYRIAYEACSYWLYPESPEAAYRIKIDLPSDPFRLHCRLIRHRIVFLPQIDAAQLDHIGSEDFWKEKLKREMKLEDDSISLLALPDKTFDRDCFWMSQYRYDPETAKEAGITTWYEEQENGRKRRRLAAFELENTDPYEWKTAESCLDCLDIWGYITKYGNAISLLQLYITASAFQQAFALHESLFCEAGTLRIFIYDDGMGIALDALSIVLSDIRHQNWKITVVRYPASGRTGADLKDSTGQYLSCFSLEEYNEASDPDGYNLAYLPPSIVESDSFWDRIGQGSETIITASVSLTNKVRERLKQECVSCCFEEYGRESIESRKYRMLEELRKSCRLYIQGAQSLEGVNDCDPLDIFDSEWSVFVIPLYTKNGFAGCDWNEKDRSAEMNKNLPAAFSNIAVPRSRQCERVSDTGEKEVYRYRYFYRVSDNMEFDGKGKPPTAFLRITEDAMQNGNGQSYGNWKKDFYSVFVSFYSKDEGRHRFINPTYLRPSTLILYPGDRKAVLLEKDSSQDCGRLTDVDILKDGFIWRFVSYFPNKDEFQNNDVDMSSNYIYGFHNEIAITKTEGRSESNISSLPRYGKEMLELFRMHQGIALHLINSEKIDDKWYPYDIPERRIYYLYRYLFKYAFEYAKSYLRLFKQAPDLIDKARSEKKLNVISFGCGNGVDYIALRMALRELGLEDTAVSYTGVDYQDWTENISIRLGNQKDLDIMFAFDEKDKAESRYIVGHDENQAESGDAFRLIKHWEKIGYSKHHDIVFFPASFRDIFGRQDDYAVNDFWNTFNLINGGSYYISIPNPVSIKNESLREKDDKELIRFYSDNVFLGQKTEVENGSEQCNYCIGCFREYQQLFHMYYPEMSYYIYQATRNTADKGKKMNNKIVLPFPRYSHQIWTNNIYRIDKYF